MALTQMERDMLSLLAHNPRARFTAEDLARLLYTNHRTPQGAAQTASSLVRKGLAEKYAGSRVVYRATLDGKNEIDRLASKPIMDRLSFLGGRK